MRSRLWRLALLLAACQTEAVPGAAPPDSVRAEAPGAGADAVGAATPRTLLALDPDGLRLVDAETGSTRPLAFGGSDDAIVPVLTRVLGAAPARSVNGECGAGPLASVLWPDGLNLWFSDGRFVGWSVDGDTEGADDYETMAGIGPGSTRDEMAGVSEVIVEETSLGTEFASGSLYGLLSGSGADARVTHLWAGTSCVFR